MKLLFDNIWIWNSVIFAAVSVGLFILCSVSKSNIIILRKYLTIPARKSSTNAVQLGGLPIALILVLAVYVLTEKSGIFLGLESLVMTRWMYCSLIIIGYGYLDDRFELRPIVKLFLQVFCILTFAALTAEIFSRYQSALSLIIVFVWGMGTINGSNLLDGLDTLTIKLTISTLAFYLISSFVFNVPMLLWASSTITAAISAFYFFNKEPAKVHLGEIGGSFMGMGYLLLSSLLYLGLKDKFGHMYAAFYSLLPLSLPMSELAISFLRRIVNRKSPFKGDRLHVHHILKNYHNFSASLSASVMMLGHLFSLTISGLLAYFLHPVVGYFAHLGLLISMYLSIGLKYWKGVDTIDLTAKSIFQFLRKKDVMIIDSSKIDEFQITIINDESDDDDDEQEVA